MRGLQVETALKRWLHLAARFVDVLSAKPLSESETAEVEALLEPGEGALFFAQTPADQRHGLEASRAVADSRRLARTALLHDVGKRHAHLGVVARVVATIFDILKLPSRGRFVQYARHGTLGAAELVDLRSPEISLGYVQHHHGAMPADEPPDEWSALQRADSARIFGR